MNILLLYLLFILGLGDEVSKDYILENYNKCIDCTTKQSRVENLAFVSYWNPLGYQYATLFGIKFDYISPAWYNIGLQTAREEPSYYNITGFQPIDAEFIREMTAHYTTKIVPRVLFERGSKEPYRTLLESNEKINEFANTLYISLLSTTYYGVVFEIFPFFDLFRGDPDYYEMRQLQLEFVDKVAEYLNDRGYKLFLVIPGYYPNNVLFTNSEFRYLAENVYRFITINYDYSWGTPGPNNPINWIEDTLNYYLQDFMNEKGEPIGDYYEYAKKLMIGVSFYGYQYTKTPTGWSQMFLVGNEILNILLHKSPELIWNDKFGELQLNFTTNGKEAVAYYPTDLSIQKRVDLAEKYGVGIAIWELGQGLTYLLQPL